MQYTEKPARYSCIMSRERNRTEAINLRVTPTVKRLLLGIVDAEGFSGESEAVVVMIREYAARKRIAPASEERYEGYKAKRIKISATFGPVSGGVKTSAKE